MTSPLIRVSGDLAQPPLPDTEGDTLTNRGFLYKYKFSLQKDDFYSVFKAPPCLSLKIILMPKRHIWGGMGVLLPFKPIRDITPYPKVFLFSLLFK